MSGSDQNASAERMLMSEFNTQSYQASSQAVPGVRVVNQTPYMNPEFPIRYRRCSILAIAILKIIVGGFQVCIGIADVYLVHYGTSDAAFPIWCGILFIVNGIIGICSYIWPSKCMIGSFLGLSIASLILSLTMMGFFSDTLHFFSWGHYSGSCAYSTSACSKYYQRFSYDAQSWAMGLTSFLMFFIIFELALSISAVVCSCQAYSRCCNTCNVDDCCSYVGCFECDTRVISNTSHQQNPQYPSNMQAQQQPSALQGLQNVATIPNTATGEPTTIQLTFQDDKADQPHNVPLEEQTILDVNTEPGLAP